MSTNSGSGDSDLGARLEQHLTGVGGRATIRPATVATAVGRARQRQRRRTAMVAGGSIVVVVCAVAAVTVGHRPTSVVTNDPPITTATPDTATPDTATPDTATPDTATPDTAAPDGTASASPGTGAEAATLSAPDGIDPMVWSGDSTFGWTTTGTGLDPSTVFVSDDGISWRTVATDPELSVTAGDRDDDGVLRLVGTPLDAAHTGDVRLTTSTDDGSSWSRVDLPLGLGPVWADPALSARTFATVGGRDGTAVVAITTDVGLGDLAARLGPDDLGTVIDVTSDGVLVPDRTIPWSELGVAPDAVPLMGRHVRLFTVLPDGTVLDAAESGLQVAERDVATVIADDEGFVVVGNRTTDVTITTFWASTDGRTWKTSASTEQSVLPIGRVGTALVSMTNRMSTSTDGATWSPYDLDGALGSTGFARWTPQGAAIRDGQLVVVVLADGSQGTASVVKDGIRIDVSSNLDTTFSDAATGEHLGGNVGGVNDGPVRTVGATFELLDDAGNVRVSFSLEEATAAIATIVDRADAWAIASTADLEHWVTTDITDLMPAPDAIAMRVDIVGGRPTVTAAAVGLNGPTAPYTVIRADGG